MNKDLNEKIYKILLGFIEDTHIPEGKSLEDVADKITTLVETAITKAREEERKELVIKIIRMRKLKHDNIEGVKDEEYSTGYLMDCSYMEAECYNAALSDICKLLTQDK